MVNVRDKIKFLMFCKVNEKFFGTWLITYQESKITGPFLAQFSLYS